MSDAYLTRDLGDLGAAGWMGRIMATDNPICFFLGGNKFQMLVGVGRGEKVKLTVAGLCLPVKLTMREGGR